MAQKLKKTTKKQTKTKQKKKKNKKKNVGVPCLFLYF